MTIPNPIFPSASRADVRSRYQLGRELGKGGGGVVRVCGDVVTGEAVAACKSIPKCKLQRKEAREELQGEVAAMRRVGGHAHVVALRALFEDAESVHLVMDLCAHGDLYDYLIARTTLPEPLAADVTRQILLALHHCHASGVVHRDIKPENILLAARDDAAGKLHLKLADFGLAVMLRAGQQAVGMYGSAVYMSPEVVCRRPYGPAVDLWGLGVILYTALSGYMPFWGSTDEQLFFRILRNQPDFTIAPWPSVAPAAIDLVRWLLSSDPAHRPSAAAALHHPWLAHHCGRIALPSPRPAPAPCVPVGAPGWAGEGGVDGGRDGKGEGGRVKAAAEVGGGAAVAGGAEGVGSGRGSAAGAAAAAAAAGGERDTEMGGVEQPKTTWDSSAGSGAAAARGEEGGRQDGTQEEQREEDSRREQGAGAAAHGSMDVDSQQGASTAQQGQSMAQQGGRQKQPKAPPIQLPLFTSFTGPASPLFSSPTANRSAAGAGSGGGGSGVFLFTARPSSGNTSHAGSGGSMWDREGSKAKHKEQQRHSHAHKQQQEQQRGAASAAAAAAAAAAGSKDGHKEGTAKAPVEAIEQKPRRSSHFRFFSPKRKARRSHVVVSTAPLPAPPPPPLSSPSPSQSPVGASHPNTQATPPDRPSSAPMASITVPLPPLDPTQELPSVPEIQARLSGPDASTTSSGGLLPSTSAPGAPAAAAAASEPSFGFGRLARPLHGMAALMRPASPSASSPALAPSPSESPQHSMGTGTGWAAARAHTHDDGSTSTVSRAPLTTSASAPNVATMPAGSAAAGPGSSAAAGPAVPHAPRRARGLSSIVKAFASLSTAAGPLGNVGSGQQHSGVSMGGVGGGGGGRESVRRGEDLRKEQQENGESPSVSRSEAVSEGVSSRDSFTWQRQGSWIFRR
ncbi:unnamed protein product [Closterium sp. Yama58-4]|nr:unnamed protein product [Closterium sp. Yama58-4]